MDLMKNDNQILIDFKENKNQYEKIEQIASSKLKTMIKEKNLFVMDVGSRVKEESSLKGKLSRKKGKYKSRFDITDLIGVRIICYFSDTVDKIASFIPELFDIDESNSIDKREIYADNQFGYLSVHYICSLKKSPEYDEELTKVRFEIQIRTVLQHAWAEIEHDLGYKSRFGVPRPIRREFSRIAGLLEIADEEFVNLRVQTKEYVSDTRRKIAEDKADSLSLDEITLQEFIQSNVVLQKVIEDNCAKLKCDYVSSRTERFLPELDWLGVKTIGDFRTFLKNNEKIMFAMLKKQVEEMELDMVTSSMFLRNVCRAELLRNNYSREQVIRYMALSYDDEENAVSHADELLDEKKYLEGEGVI